tara:strand:- start:554 stop:745 length:192 start_codon:yes stop_codon:yes gene_type:complete
MTKAKIEQLKFDRDMWKLRYVALCEMTADILDIEDEEVNEIINSQINNYVTENNLFEKEKLNG